MANILILSLIFRPDNVSTAQIMGDLALDLKNRGHNLFVISTLPHFNDDAEALATQPIGAYWGKVLQRSKYHGIEVLHVWMPRKGRSKLVRILAWLGFHIVSTVAACASRFRPDIILTPSPPLTIGISAWLVGLWHRCPFVYNVQEIYPDVAVNLGVVTNKTLVKSLRRIEDFVYTKAKALTIISDEMADNIRRKGVPAGKIHILPNFVDTEDFRPLSKINSFSTRYKLSDRFVIGYAGNMGVPQGLDILIDAAGLLRDEKDIHFLMMGDGTEKPSLIKKVQQVGLTNITFLSYQPYSMMAEAYAAVDISFVSQAPGTSSNGIPSKVYRILSCARPVIACTDAGSYLSRLIRESDSGAVVESGDIHELAETIKSAYLDRDTWAQKGKNGRQFVVDHYSRHTISSKYHELITQLIAEC